MSEPRDKFRREFWRRFKCVLGEDRWLKFLDMAENGELEKQRRRFFEMLNSGEAEQYLKRYDFQREFPKYFN